MQWASLISAALVASVALAADPGIPPAPGADSDFQHLADFYRGLWSCSGHFANGKPISSDESFETWADGRWLHEIHDDHPPFSYHAHSVWGVDSAAHILTLAIHDNFGGVRLFTSSTWDGPTITFDAQPILGHPPSTERFVFTRVSPQAFSFEYQVPSAAGGWKMGDHVVCARAHPQTRSP